MSDAVLQASGLRKTYPSGDKTLGVLAGVDLAVAAGESVSIRGESGSGKSTLLNLLAGLDRPDAGELFWGGEAAHKLSLGDLTSRRGRFLGMVFQAYYLIPEIDALANVLMGARMVGSVGAAQRERAAHRATRFRSAIQRGTYEPLPVRRVLTHESRVVRDRRRSE